MDFNVRFITGSKAETLIIGLTHDCGYSYIDQLRGEGKLFGLPIKKIHVDTSCPYWNKPGGCLNLEIEDEDQIRKVPQFFARSLVYVKVPAGFMGRYYKLKVQPKFEEKKGRWHKPAITSCNISSKLDSAALIEDWIAAGCPEEWDLAEPTAVNLYEVTTTFDDGTHIIVATDIGQMYSRLVSHIQSYDSYNGKDRARKYHAQRVLGAITNVKTTQLTPIELEYFERHGEYAPEKYILEQQAIEKEESRSNCAAN